MSLKTKTSPESVVRDIKRKTRRKFTVEEKIRIVLEGLRGEQSITDLCRKEGVHPTPANMKRAVEKLGEIFGQTRQKVDTVEIKKSATPLFLDN